VTQGIKSVSIELCALYFRRGLVSQAHHLYFESSNAQRIISGTADMRVDNPDNRITHDIFMLTTTTADLVGKTLTAPGAIIYCKGRHYCILITTLTSTLRLTRFAIIFVPHSDTCYLWTRLGWTGPAACYIFFIVGACCNAFFSRHLVGLVYRQVG